MSKSPKQLNADIKEALAGSVSTSAPKRLTKTQIQKLQVELRKAIKYAKSEAARRGLYMKHDDYERAAADAICAAGLQGRAAAQPSDESVEIWEVIPGVGAMGNQIAAHHDDDYI